MIREAAPARVDKADYSLNKAGQQDEYYVSMENPFLLSRIAM